MIYDLYDPDKGSKEVLDLKSHLTSGDESFGWRRRKFPFFRTDSVLRILKVVMGLWPGVGLMGYVSNVLSSIEGYFCYTEVADTRFFHSGSQS